MKVDVAARNNTYLLSCSSAVAKSSGLGWFLCFESPQADIKVWVGLRSV